MHILYVDDEKDLLELAQAFFADENIPIDVAQNMENALALIQKKDYDLIISDVRMPSGSGIDLITRARNEHHFRGKFILVSGQMTSKLETMADCDLLLTKPIDFSFLIDSVRNLLNSQ